MTLIIENTTIRLVDLLPPGQYVIEGLQAKNVMFLGPAVMFIQGTLSLRGDSQFRNELHEIIWELPDTQDSVVGAVGLFNPTFEDCQFEGLGFAGKHDAITALLGRTIVKPQRDIDEN